MAEARRFTNAEAGTLFLREGEALRFRSCRTSGWVARLGEHEMRRRLMADVLAHEAASLAGHVANSGVPDDVIAAADLIPVADRALYVGKRLGRNTIQSA